MNLVNQMHINPFGFWLLHLRKKITLRVSKCWGATFLLHHIVGVLSRGGVKQFAPNFENYHLTSLNKKIILIAQPESFEEAALHLTDTTGYITVCITLLFKICKCSTSVFSGWTSGERFVQESLPLIPSVPACFFLHLLLSCVHCDLLLGWSAPALHFIQV